MLFSLSTSLSSLLDKRLNPSGGCEAPSTPVLSSVSRSGSHHASRHHQHPVARPPAGRISDARHPLRWDDARPCVSTPVVRFAQSSRHVWHGRDGPVSDHGQPGTADVSSGGQKPRRPDVPQQSQDCMRAPPCASNTVLRKANQCRWIITQTFSPGRVLQHVFNSASGSNHNLSSMSVCFRLLLDVHASEPVNMRCEFVCVNLGMRSVCLRSVLWAPLARLFVLTSELNLN